MLRRYADASIPDVDADLAIRLACPQQNATLHGMMQGIGDQVVERSRQHAIVAANV
ncbi:hypothetical protein D3C76_789670 [compost metagenome]